MAKFGYEPKYVNMVLDAIRKGIPIQLGASGGSTIQVLFSEELSKVFKVSATSNNEAMKYLKNGNLYLPLFVDKSTKKSYKWTDIYKGQFSGASRKNSTASSNVNEVFSLYFLINTYQTFDYEKIVSDLSDKNSTAFTGIVKGANTNVTYKDLLFLLSDDTESKSNLKIGFNNANAIKGDISKKIKSYHWCPREKPNGVPSTHPSDIVLVFDDDSMLGYSNKAIKGGKDMTPKFNTSVTAFYTGHPEQATVNNIIDASWNESLQMISPMLRSIITKHVPDISKEPYTEGGSKTSFNSIGDEFEKLNVDFYKGGFYYIYRNNFIKNYSKYLKTSKTLSSMLNIIYRYTFNTTADSLPYKLLVGSTSTSIIKEVSANETLKRVLLSDSIKNINVIYDGSSQSFSINAKVDDSYISFDVTNRTRASGGWAGKSLFMTTPGLTIR